MEEIMNNEYNLSMVIDNDVLHWVLENSDTIESITPKVLLKIMDIKVAEPDRWKEMANIKFGI